MKILIVGTGVIGCIYGWQLYRTGNSITHFVRAGKKDLAANGFIIRCLDTRGKKRAFIEALYKPELVEQINGEYYDLIMVPVKANQLGSILPLLAQTNKNTCILFLQNLWVTHIEEIKKTLDDARIIYGQAHAAGGGKKDNIITCTIFGNKHAATMLGKKDGSIPKQVLRIQETMAQAGLNPRVSKNILAWLFSHYAEANGLVAGVMEAGTARKYILDKQHIEHSVRLIREGFKVCSALGICTLKIYPQVLYYFPMGCLLPALQRMYSTEESQLMIQNHISHSPDEMKEMFYDVFHTGKNLGLSMECYRQMQKYVEHFT
jgi:ketopantoate reductase